jgi:hypothetical protein
LLFRTDAGKSGSTSAWIGPGDFGKLVVCSHEGDLVKGWAGSNAFPAQR